MEIQLKKQLQDWYSAGFLSLNEISWDTSSASVLTFVKDAEAVHPVKFLEDLKMRMSGNRKAFGLFHQSLPHAPVAFIMCALMDAIPSSLGVTDIFRETYILT